MINVGTRTATCGKCGKTFLMRCPGQYAYKINDEYYCSYSCFIQDKKIILEEKNRKIKEELKGYKKCKNS